MKKLFAFSRILLIVAVLFGLWGALPVEHNAQAATITVCSSGCDYTTIQAAVSAANPGDVIEIKAGTYTSGTINISKQLTIKGVEAGVVIAAGSSGGYGLDIQANDFTIENVQIQNNNGTNYGLKISGSNDVTVKNVEVTGFVRSGVDLIGCNTASIENVNSHDNGGVGIAISNSTNITLNGITTSNNVWGGVALFTNASYYTGNLSDGKTGLDGIYLEGTNSFGEANPLYTELAEDSHVIRNFSQTEFSYVVRNTALPKFTWYQKTKDSSLALINAAGTAFKTTAAIQQLSDGSFYVFDTMKIQPAIDLASVNGKIYIYPGTYDETASNRYVLGTNGPHQFGLFIAEDKNGISLIGVDDDGIPIDNYSQVKATITTNATNNFGYSGIFVEADDVTIQGLQIGKNNQGDNKTIEVIGNNFTLKNSQIDVEEGGSVYINDWRFDDTTQTSHVKSYYIEDNWFRYGSSVDIASGAGYSGDIQNRRIIGNRFTNDSSSNVYWALVSFNGFGEVPWFTKPIGGAIVQDNEFSGSTQYIRARSNYDNTQFNWKAFWEDNTFDKAVVTLSDVENFDVRAYSYTSGSYNFTNVRRIGAVIQGEVDNADSGDTILAKPGQYTENITINKRINLIGSGSGDDPNNNTVLRKNTNSAIITLSASGIDGAPILLKDLRIEPVGVYGINVPSGSVEYITLQNVNVVGSKPTNDTESEVGFKVATSATLRYLTVENSGFDNLHYGWYFAKHGDWTTNSSTVENVFVQNTTFKENAAKGIYVEKLSKATFTNVIVEGNGWNTSFWNARWNAGIDINLKGETGGKTYQDLVFNNLEVRNNAKGTRDGAGLMIKARDDGNTYSQYPATLIGVEINGGWFEGNERGIRFGEPDKDNAGPTNVVIQNSLFRNNLKTYTDTDGSAYGGVINYTLSQVKAERNWWDSPSGPANSANPGGSGQPAAGDVDFAPWLCDGTDSQPDQIGFQPSESAATCTATSEATRLVFVQYPDGGFENVPFATQPVVRAEDDDGNLAVNFNGGVILYLANNPAGGALQGSLVTNAVNGVAAFSGVSISKAGENYQLAAIAASLEPAVSGSFNVQPQNADLAVSINASPNPVETGAALTYTVGVQNLGPLPASNLTLTVNLPDGVTFINAGGTGWTCSQSGGVVTCTRFSLAATSSAPDVTITVSAPDQAGSITATASIEADTLDLVSDNNSASVSTLVVTIPETGGITIYLPLVKK